MRGGRTLLFLVAAAAGLGAYIYFVESERDPNAVEPKTKVFAVEANAIERLEIRAATGEVTSLEKSGDTWKMTAPVAAAVDDGAVRSIADTLSTAEITSVLDEAPTNIHQFGLEPARLSVSFRKAGDATDYRLNLGDKTPVGSDIYAQVAGQPRVLLLGSFLEDTFNRKPFDLRDKKALSFERDAVDKITIERPSAPKIDLVREGSEWKLTAPIAARADFSPVDGLISRVEQAQMTGIALEGREPTTTELKTFGLDRPQLVTTFGAGSTRASIAIGGEKDPTSVYARDLSRSLVFTVDKALLTDLQKQPADLRVKDVFVFKSYTAVGIDVTYGGVSASYQKATPTAEAAAGPDVWKQTKPEAKDVNATAMTDLLNTVSSLRAESFVTSVPGSGEDMVVVARYGDANKPTEERVTLRKSGTTAYAISPKDPGAAVIPVADFDKAVTQLKALTGAK